MFRKWLSAGGHYRQAAVALRRRVRLECHLRAKTSQGVAGEEPATFEVEHLALGVSDFWERVATGSIVNQLKVNLQQSIRTLHKQVALGPKIVRNPRSGTGLADRGPMRKPGGLYIIQRVASVIVNTALYVSPVAYRGLWRSTSSQVNPPMQTHRSARYSYHW